MEETAMKKKTRFENKMYLELHNQIFNNQTDTRSAKRNILTSFEMEDSNDQGP